jgi:hypothetical protein
MDQTQKLGKVQMLLLILGISSSGLVLVACLTHWYLRRSKAVSNLVLENMNVMLISKGTEGEIAIENIKTEKQVILPTVMEKV